MSNGWEYDQDPNADHLFGVYYQWCALLCGLGEASLEQGLLSESQLDMLRPDLEATLPWIRACRQVLVTIPASREDHPRLVDLLRDSDTLDRLDRLHRTLGKVLQEEQTSRLRDVLTS